MRVIKMIFLLCMMCIFLLGCSAFALEADAAEADSPDGDASVQQVYDEAGILDQSEIDALTEAVNGLEIQSGWDAFVLTIGDADGYTAQQYGELFFNEHAAKEDGVVCILDMDNREIALVTSGEAIRYMTDDRIDDTLDYVYEYAADGDYGDALSTMVMYVSYYYGKGIPKGQANYDTDTGEYSPYVEPRSITPGELVFALVVGCAAAVGSMLLITGKYRLKLGVEKDGFFQHSRLHVTYDNDRLINRYVTTRRIPKNPPPGKGGGSISSTHTGMGGGTFGGGSRKF